MICFPQRRRDAEIFLPRENVGMRNRLRRLKMRSVSKITSKLVLRRSPVFHPSDFRISHDTKAPTATRNSRMRRYAPLEGCRGRQPSNAIPCTRATRTFICLQGKQYVGQGRRNQKLKVTAPTTDHRSLK